ncbi:MAG: hypothetical protein C4297_14890 [Gemmataceae bacterium]
MQAHVEALEALHETHRLLARAEDLADFGRVADALLLVRRALDKCPQSQAARLLYRQLAETDREHKERLATLREAATVAQRALDRVLTLADTGRLPEAEEMLAVCSRWVPFFPVEADRQELLERVHRARERLGSARNKERSAERLTQPPRPAPEPPLRDKLERTITVRFRDASIGDIVRSLAQETGIAFRVEESVAPMRLPGVWEVHHVTVRQALRELSQRTGLSYLVVGEEIHLASKLSALAEAVRAARTPPATTPPRATTPARPTVAPSPPERLPVGPRPQTVPPVPAYLLSAQALEQKLRGLLQLAGVEVLPEEP